MIGILIKYKFKTMINIHAVEFINIENKVLKKDFFTTNS